MSLIELLPFLNARDDYRAVTQPTLQDLRKGFVHIGNFVINMAENRKNLAMHRLQAAVDCTS